MTIHPEDALAYADQLHRDMKKLGDLLERIATALERLAGSHGIVYTRDADRV